METLQAVLDYVFSFKAYVMLPLIILVIALAGRMRLGAALLSALRIAVGFAGVFVVFDFFVASIGPAVEQLVLVRGFDFPVLDVGWPPLAAITWASPIAPLTIPIFLVLNVIMLATRTTTTINIDIWNYWHYALVGSLVLNTTRSLWLGLAVTLLIGIYSIKMADWNGVYVEQRAGIKGVAITTISINGLLPYAVVMDWLFDRIPGIRSIRWNPEAAGERDHADGAHHSALDLLSEPMIIGGLLGLFLGLLAGYQLRELLELGVHIAAVMFLLPPCGKLIGEGIQPVSTRLRDIIATRFRGRTDLRVGMDSGPLLQNRSVLVTGMILMPLSIGLAFVVPGNRTLPLGDLPNLISVFAIIVLVFRNNVFRAVLAGIPIVATYMMVATHFAGLYTTMAQEVGFDFQGHVGPITAFTDGGNQIRFYFFHLFQGNGVAIAAIPVILGLMWITRQRSIALQRAAAQAAEQAER
jgi:PTS system galactitol-specific IIC component